LIASGARSGRLRRGAASWAVAGESAMSAKPRDKEAPPYRTTRTIDDRKTERGPSSSPSSNVRVVADVGLLCRGLADMALSRRPPQAPQAPRRRRTAICARRDQAAASKNSKPPARSREMPRESQQKAQGRYRRDRSGSQQGQCAIDRDRLPGCAGVEARIGDVETRLRPLDTREQQISRSLDSRRAEIVEVLAALQRAGRRNAASLAGEA